MVIIAIVDENKGMMFNGRRQSQDKILRERILEITEGKRIWMHPYSAGQFEALPENAVVDHDYLRKAQQGEYCFVEKESVKDCYPEKVILFQWNRNYPADRYFDLDLSQWILEEKREFAGYSHEKITEEVYRNGQLPTACDK